MQEQKKKIVSPAGESSEQHILHRPKPQSARLIHRFACAILKDARARVQPRSYEIEIIIRCCWMTMGRMLRAKCLICMQIIWSATRWKTPHAHADHLVKRQKHISSGFCQITFATRAVVSQHLDLKKILWIKYDKYNTKFLVNLLTKYWVGEAS